MRESEQKETEETKKARYEAQERSATGIEGKARRRAIHGPSPFRPAIYRGLRRQFFTNRTAGLPGLCLGL